MADKGSEIEKNFGVVIAFWLPGFVLLWGLTYSFPEVSKFLPKSTETEAPTVGGFLYVTLASLAVGLMVSAVRWMLVDIFLHDVTRVKRPNIDFGKLTEKDAYLAFQGIVENHYRYYQYYANTLVALVAAFFTYLIVHGVNQVSWFLWTAFIISCFSLSLASRDCLVKYCTRAEQIAPPSRPDGK